ncbi:MAG: conjugal transfer protein TraH (plasmid) [Candidatus Manganitrophus sp.]|nr:MAG: conjugal transfer protein TraH [Candidatus Manganitrophus sp.]
MNRLFINIVAISLLLDLGAAAAYAGSMQEFLDNAIIEVENPTAVQSQERNFLWGGGLHLRTPNMVFQPFQVTPPRLKAGCGGIDITFGGFSYFNQEHLVDFLEQVIAAAPAFAFNVALATVCEQCETAATTLTSLANSINGLNMTSCQAAQVLGGATGQLVGNTINERIIGGQESSWLRGVNESLSSANRFVQDFEQTLTAAGCDPANPACVHYNFRQPLLTRALADTYFNDGPTEYFLRYLIGDVIPIFPADLSQSRGITPMVLPESALGGDFSALISQWIWGSNPGECTQVSVDLPGYQIVASVPTPVTVTLQTLCSRVGVRMDSIFDKLVNRQVLVSDDLQFLNAFRMPLYKLINLLSIQPLHISTLRVELINILSTQLAYETLSAIATEFYRGVARLETAGRSDRDPLNGEDARMMRQRMGGVTRAGYELTISRYDNFHKQLETWQKTVELEKRLVGQMAQHPILGAYHFSKGLVNMQ